MGLLDIIKLLLPFLRSAAEKSLKKLPKEKQDQLINISKLVEIVKKLKNRPYDEVVFAINSRTNLTPLQAGDYLKQYLAQKGIKAEDLLDSLNYIWRELNDYQETGIKGFLHEMVNVLGEVIAGIDWKALVLGISEIVYRKYVKNKLDI